MLSDKRGYADDRSGFGPVISATFGDAASSIIIKTRAPEIKWQATLPPLSPEEKKI